VGLATASGQLTLLMARPEASHHPPPLPLLSTAAPVFSVEVLEFGSWGIGFGFGGWGLGFEFGSWGLGFGVGGWGFEVWGIGFEVWSLRIRV